MLITSGPNAITPIQASPTREIIIFEFRRTPEHSPSFMLLYMYGVNELFIAVITICMIAAMLYATE